MHRRARVARYTSILFLMSTLAAGSATLTAGELSPHQIELIRLESSATRERDSLPGLQIAVARGESVWSEGFGSADLEQEVALDRKSMLRTASISKWLTATAANKLAEAGKLDLDAPVQRYCAHFPRKDGEITSRLLLNHLSGIRHYYGGNGEQPRTDEERKALEERSKREESTQFVRYTDVTEPLNAFKDDPLVFAPGTRLLYSSYGYRLLGCVLEGAARQSYRALMRELVFAPAGLGAITEDDALAIVPNRVAGYSRGPDGALIRARFRDVSENLPAGGHLASSEELVRFAIAFNSGRLVNPATRARMLQRPRLADGQEAPFTPPFFGLGAHAYYGMGVFVLALDDELLVAHTGSQTGVSTQLLLAPERNIAVAVMTNVDRWRGMHALATKILQIAALEEAKIK